MNYRHHFHAGNFADVIKHALVMQLVRGLQRKPRGCLLLDTHAGRGSYDLAAAGMGDSLARRPEYPDGIGRLWASPGLPDPLAAYLDLVRKFNARMERAVPGTASKAAGPRFYPGSPWLLRLLARPIDRLALCEKHPEECAALKANLGAGERVSVHAMDGYDALAAMLPPPERRGFVLIDPPFEDGEEAGRIVGALRRGLKRFPSGTYVIWYPLTARAGLDALFEGVAALSPPPTLKIEVVVDPSAPKMRGCGLLVINPPWQFEREALPTTRCLAQLLAQGPGSGDSLRWLVPERTT